MKLSSKSCKMQPRMFYRGKISSCWIPNTNFDCFGLSGTKANSRITKFISKNSQKKWFGKKCTKIFKMYGSKWIIIKEKEKKKQLQYHTVQICQELWTVQLSLTRHQSVWGRLCGFSLDSTVISVITMQATEEGTPLLAYIQNTFWSHYTKKLKKIYYRRRNSLIVLQKSTVQVEASPILTHTNPCVNKQSRHTWLFVVVLCQIPKSRSNRVDSKSD